MAICPWAVLHDRMSFQDSVLTLLGLLAVLGTWEATDRISYRTALLASLAAFLASQSKQSGLLLVPIILLVALTQLGKDRLRARLVMCIAIAIAGPLLGNMIQRLGLIAPTSGDETHFQWFTHTWPNLRDFDDNLLIYFGPALIAMTCLGIAASFRRDRRVTMFLLGVILCWTMPPILFSSGAPSRYHLPALPFLLALSALGIQWLWHCSQARHIAVRWAAAGLILVAFAWPLADAAAMVWNFKRAVLALRDDGQYRSSALAGYAPMAASAALDQHPIDGCQVIYWLGVPELMLYSTNYPRIVSENVVTTVAAGDDMPAVLPDRVAYIMLDGKHSKTARWLTLLRNTYPQMELLGTFDNPGGRSGALLVRIAPTRTARAPR
jgi:4-amino-4-deoxy-L-arabinose transferase-like glycosyltransferase